jgi:hemolysin III
MIDVRLKDPFSSLSHAVGSLLAVAGLVLLIVWSKGDPWRVTSFAIYGATLILLFAASALYHGLKVSKRAEKALYGLDRTGIFLLIAGTYTPICLVGLGGGWGWSLFGVIWGMAVIGIALDWATKQGLPHWAPALFYLAMGWVFLIGIKPLLAALTPAMLIWLAAGALLYSIGAAICVRHPEAHPEKHFHFHDLWHAMVLGASACHFVVMALLARA